MEYVSQVALDINGASIDDFEKVREGVQVLRKQVNLMRKTGTIKTTPRHTVGLDYVIPSDGPEFDFSTVVGATLTIDYLNGKRVTYAGVSTLEIGETEFSEDNEAIRKVLFSAEDRVEE